MTALYDARGHDRPARTIGAARPDAAPVAECSGVARWRQIARSLQAEIARGLPEPGGRLPTEAQLATRFGVNRHTVRRALEEMARDGLIVIEQGRGSFVAEDVLDYAVGARPRFSEWIRAHDKTPSGRVLDLRETEADAAVALGLGVPAGTMVIQFDRLGLADGRPIGLGRHHFVAGRLPGLAEALLECPSITQALARVGLADYRRQVTRVTARMPTAEEATLLAMARNRPVLVTEAVNVDPHDAIVEFGISRYPTPRVQLVFEP